MNDNPKSLAGNPYADAVKLHKDHGNNISPAAQATLALAFEQRTATLVQLVRALADTGQRDRMEPYLHEIDDRLGMTEEP